jgi:hypothetical protein
VIALALEGKPVEFIKSHIALSDLVNEGGSPFSVLSAAVNSSPNKLETATKRFAHCNEVVYPAKERDLLARTIIRKHDTQNTYHCNKKNCGNDCIFAPVCCPNENCDVIYSLKWAAKHDEICPHKIVGCYRECGETFPRRTTDTHLDYVCALRPVPCPFRLGLA